MTRCLACERHTIYRVVLQFTREAIIAQRHIPLLEKFVKTASINWETPELTQRGMKGGAATIIIDKEFLNQQKRTIMAYVKEIKKLVNSDDLDDGFISVYEESDRVELLTWEEAPACKTKKGTKK